MATNYSSPCYPSIQSQEERSLSSRDLFRLLRASNRFLPVLYILLTLLLMVSASAAYATPQCSDGIDNDGDGKTDALVTLNPNNGQTRSWSRNPGAIRNFVNSKAAEWGFTPLSHLGALHWGDTTAQFVCKLAGFRDVTYKNCSSPYGSGCGYHSPHDNWMFKWNPTRGDFDWYRAHKYTDGWKWLASLTCTNRLAQCSDGRDNDNDGRTDYPNDSGCASANDDSELPDDPDCTGPSDPSEFPDIPQCRDGVDNDQDGATDYPNDFSCSSGSDTDETNPKAQCQNGVDDDRDGKTDYPADLGCSSKQDNDESGGGAQCQDGIDNDRDGLTDYPADPGCYAPHDNSERNFNGPQCDNGVDDDNDGKTDFPNDPDCTGPTDPTEGPTLAQCQDGVDNDQDGATDHPADFSCSSPTDRDETNPKAQCQNGVDDDRDGKTDYPADPGCTSKQDNDESGDGNKQCQDGIDNDRDGLTDFPADPGCYAPHDNNERNINGPQCDNGIDDDQDGKTDFPNDPDCTSPTDPTEGAPTTAQCGDGVDNDHDGATDYPNDFSCSSRDDNDETNPKAQCQNGIDDDHDGKTDYPADPGCTSKQDNDESGEVGNKQCQDGQDNDLDGLTDFPADPGCYAPHDNNERNINGPECDNGLDDDQDGKTDYPDDSDCTGPTDPEEGGGGPGLACNDGIDNDRDGLTDYPNDPGCYAPHDDSERDPNGPQCDDGIDNDHDGVADYPDDPDCSGPTDPCECGQQVAQCADGVDNDQDGATDYPNDFSCSSANDPDEANPKAQCQNGVDDDQDGKTDYPADPGCRNKQDNNEADDGRAQCQNGIDDDNDGLIDMADPGCYAPHDNNERDIRGPECDNGLDDDRDGYTDYPDDPDCTGPRDTTEGGTIPPGDPECSDGLDNDNDGKIDALVEADSVGGGSRSWSRDPGAIRNFVNSKAAQWGFTPLLSIGAVHWGDVSAQFVCRLAGFADVRSKGCSSPYGSSCGYHSPHDNWMYKWNPTRGDFDRYRAHKYTDGWKWLASLTCENRLPACSDGIDNDNDGKTDFPEDDGCASERDTSEIPHDPDCESPDDPFEGTDGPIPPTPGDQECRDGQDNDRDGLTDYPADPGCYAPHDNNERNIRGPQCDNGLDDDLDGRFDYPNDTDCTGPTDCDERAPCTTQPRLEGGESARVALASLDCDPGVAVGPGTPTNLRASDGTSADYVEVTWEGVPGATSYQVYRSEFVDEIGEPLGEPTTETRIVDRSAVPGVDYYYTATASDDTGEGVNCNTNWGYRFDASGLGDYDGDGVSDTQEDADGTDPDDRGSFQLHLQSPAYTKYNTFLKQWNFLELIASGSEAITAVVTVYLSDGSELAAQEVTVPANTEVDVDINTLIAQGCAVSGLCSGYVDLDGNGVIDTYGVVRIDFNAEGEGQSLIGRMSSYRQDADGTFSFAYTKELRNPTQGKTYATANTYDPQATGYLVPNWVEIINLSDEEQTFTCRLYNQEGTMVKEESVTIAPLGEVDLPAGHEITDESGAVVESVYLVEVEPADGAARYFATVSRYSSNAPAGFEAETYNFAFALDARAGNGSTQFMPTTNQVGACYSQTNWVEVVNVRERAVIVTLIFRAEDGSVVETTEYELAAKAQYHFNASAFLGQGAIGSVELRSSEPGALIAQSLVYYHDCAENRVQTAYASLARIAGGAVQAGTLNTFLGMENAVRVIGTAAAEAQLGAELRTAGESASNAAVLGLGSYATSSINAGADGSVLACPADNYGTLTLGTNESGKFVADVLRVRPAANGGVDFALPTAVQ